MRLSEEWATLSDAEQEAFHAAHTENTIYPYMVRAEGTILYRGGVEVLEGLVAKGYFIRDKKDHLLFFLTAKGGLLYTNRRELL